MKKFLFLGTILFTVLLIGCQEKEEVEPEERLQEYADHWMNQEFEKMYKMVAETEKEDFIDRYQKIYKDLEINKVDVSFDVPDTEEKEKNDEAETEVFPLKVSMESVAGPITFDTEVEMIKVVKEVEGEEKTDWLVNWNPGLIFPEIKDGGTIGLETIEPKRGEIYDRNREGLAVNASVYELGVVPEQFTDDKIKSEKETIAKALGITVEEIDNALDANWVQPNYFVPLKVVPSLTDEIEKAISSVPTLKTQTTTGRIYPLGEAAAHLVGYIAPVTAEKLEELDDASYSENDMVGYRGLEELYEEQLRGEAGVKITVEREGQEPVILAEKEVKNGENLNLTIDIKAQKKIFEQMDNEPGTATAIDPKTGETLALVSSPSFDPNAFIYGLSNTQWTEWQEDPNNPLLNRFASTFAPGSVFKPITSTVGLENGSIDPNETFEIDGLTWQKEGWGNYYITRVSPSNGPVDLDDALVRSDNIYFAMQALDMGADAFVKGLKEFGLGEDVPFTYPIEKSTISSDGNITEEVLLADSSYGQGEVQMSALHLASAFSIFLNDGNMVKPTLLLDEADGESWKQGLISAENASLIKESMRRVVTHGTGKAANLDSIEIAGKTGTAELKQSKDEENGQENGWFVGYPTDGSILISMFIEHVEDNNGSGYVTEKAANVLAELKE